MATNPIPIRNLFLLLCYAWGRLEEGDIIAVAAEDCDQTSQLLARILIHSVRRLIKEGLDRSYVSHTDDMRILRGRMLVGETIKRQLLLSGRLRATYDELSEDNLLNRIIKATLLRLSHVAELAPKTQSDLLHLAQRLRDISPVRLTPSVFRQVQIHRHNGFYGLVIDVCELVYFSTFVSEEDGEIHFRDFVRDENRMWQVFQDFIRNFYRLHYPECNVRAEQIVWDLESDAPTSPRFLPKMMTDIVIRDPGRVIVIDTKFYQEALTKSFGAEMARSAHLYQLFAYLRNLQPTVETDIKLGGVLLYPTVKYELNEHYRVQQCSMWLATVDLSKDWKAIEHRLHQILQQVA